MAEAARCINPQTQKYLYRKKNGSFKTSKFNRAVRDYNRCMAGKLTSFDDGVEALGDAAMDLLEGALGGGSRPAYVPAYAEGSGWAPDAGDTPASQPIWEAKLAGVPIVGIAAVAAAFLFAMRK